MDGRKGLHRNGMIDKNELIALLEEIENDKKIALQTEVEKQMQESTQRRIDAITYIESLPLTIDTKLSLPEQKLELYSKIEFIKTEIKTAQTGELQQELYKKIPEILEQINLVKDQQREVKISGEVDIIGS
jgi:hypothetical protein